MQKTKLGISVALLGAILYFMGVFGGFTVVTLMTGYIFLCEENIWLKKAALKTIILMIVFWIINVLVGFVPDIVDVIHSVGIMFGRPIYSNFISGLSNLLVAVFGIIEKVLFLGLALSALSQGTIAIPFVDRLIDKHME